MDLVQPLGHGRLQPRNSNVVVTLLESEGPALHVRDELANIRIDRVQLPFRTGNPGAEIQLDSFLQVTVLEGGLLCREEGSDLVGPVVIRKAGADESQGRDPLRRFDRELEGRVPTERRANGSRPLDAGFVHRLTDGSSE
jgi:hypothetical protein